MLDATKVNPQNLHGDRKINAVGDIGAGAEEKCLRLRPWLINANQNVTHSSQLIGELKRVRVLKVEKEKMIVSRKD